MSSGFITESEIEEKRKLRQEQWEKVRKPEEPMEVPEEPVDTRSLFERLQEQKTKKQEDFEEAHKLKNLVKTLDDDEVQFLDYVDQVRQEDDKRKRLEEAKELLEFRSAVSQLREKEFEKALHEELGLVEKPKATKAPAVSTSKKTSQIQLLAGLVKRKSQDASSSSTSGPAVKKHKEDSATSPVSETPIPAAAGSAVSASDAEIPSVPHKGNLVCIGVLPGLASYSDSDSDSDGDGNNGIGIGHVHKDNCCKSDIGKPQGVFLDLCGRKLQFVEKEEKK